MWRWNPAPIMVGFVFFAPSPRHLALEAARALGARVKGRAGKVALTVDADDETLAAVVEALKPDMLQLHGVETPERVTAVRTRFGLPVMKALPIAERKRSRAHRTLQTSRRPADLRCARAAGCHPAGRPRQAVRLDAAARASTLAFRSCCRAGSMPAMSPRRCASRARRASMSPPASSARPAKKTRTRSAPSSAPRVRPTPRWPRKCSA